MNNITLSPPVPKARIYNLIPSRDTEHDFPASLSRSVSAAATEVIPAKFSAINVDQAIYDQGSAGCCVGGAIAEAILYQFIQHDYRWVARPLSTWFIWQNAKMLDPYPMTTPLSALDGTSIKTGLDVARKLGNVYRMWYPDGTTPLWDTQGMRDAAAYFKIKSYYNLAGRTGIAEWIRNICRWVSLNRQVVLGINVLQSFVNIGTKTLQLSDTGGVYVGAHACRIVGYEGYDANNPLATVFVIGNSWGQSWGAAGYGRVTGAYLEKIMFETYGIEEGNVIFYE